LGRLDGGTLGSMITTRLPSARAPQPRRSASRRPPTISELRVREERARVALAVALHRALRTCATAARELDDLDAHVAAVRLRLRRGGRDSRRRVREGRALQGARPGRAARPVDMALRAEAAEREGAGTDGRGGDDVAPDHDRPKADDRAGRTLDDRAGRESPS